MTSITDRKTLVTGARGFVGRALVPALRAAGHHVVAASRRPGPHPGVGDGVEWRVCDLLRPETLPGALAGVGVAYYLVHSMGGGHDDFRELERRSARAFVDAAADAGLERIVYLGGPAPRGRPSEHLASRLEVGEILRAGAVPAVELRASMLVGGGSASWQIVRDLSMRLPAMVLPRWLRSRTRPVALEDAVAALVAAATMPIDGSPWFDIPGPETLTGREILERIAALQGRHIPAVEVPLLTPHLSALWLKLVTRADFSLARELVLGLGEDLLPEDEGFWERIGHTDLVPFDVAARRALANEPRPAGARQWLGRAEERLVERTARRRLRG
ncbi:MAG: NAD(P)H-binding protein [Myxococcota bacterium]